MESEGQEPTNTPFSTGALLGIKSAVIGSVIFAFVELLTIIVGSYLIRLPKWTWEIIPAIRWSVEVFLFTIAVTFIPALVFGGVLAIWLNHDGSKHRLSDRKAVVKGTLLGILASLMISLPILRFFTAGRGLTIVLLGRTITAITIATFAGGWTGKRLAKLFLTPSESAGHEAGEAPPSTA